MPRVCKEPGTLPPPMVEQWATEIEVVRKGNSITLIGTNPDPNNPPRNLLDDYKRFVWASTRELETKGLHIEFGNLSSDDEMIRFMARNGPIIAQSIGLEDDEERSVMATEDLTQLRQVHRVFKAALELVRIVRQDPFRSDVALSALDELIGSLIANWETNAESFGAPLDYELIGAQTHSLGTVGALTEERLLFSCEDALCVLLNRFPEVLICTDKGVISGPATGFGLMPLLMFFLRQDFVNQRQIGQCMRCGEYFLEKRFGQRACSIECAGRLRAALYYERHQKQVLSTRKKKRMQDRRKNR